jgi:U3 small nucleolar RNA-associated protein 11
MSSLRNAVKRITHKERSQPNDRKHLGLLEKKKDYVQRAQDYHRKQDRIQRLQQKASMRNPEEFYFRMHSSAMKDGKHTSSNVEDSRQYLSPQLVRIMKDQDLKWVRMQRQQDQKKVEKLQACLHQLDGNTTTTTYQQQKRQQQTSHPAKHIIFVDTQEQATNFTVANHFDTIPELAHRSFNRLRKGDIAKMAAATTTTTTASTSSIGSSKTMIAKHQADPTTILPIMMRRSQAAAAKARSRAYREWQARQDRIKALTLAEQQLQTEKLVAGKGRKRKIAAATPGQHPAQYQWRRQRLK